MAQLGEILAELRQERGMTQKALGHVLCVSAGTISNYEKGVHLPDADTVIRLPPSRTARACAWVQ